MAKVLHVLALGLWFGGAGFFNFVTAPSLFRSFAEVVETAPSDRTAGVAIVPPGTSEQARKDLASALAGAAVGPIFPKYFALQGVCGVVALVTAALWRDAGGSVHRWRVAVLVPAVLTVAAGWTLSDYVGTLRLQRFDPDPAVAEAARAAFGPWHLASLGLSVVTVALAGVALALAAKLPQNEARP
jgi:hypothetical protein